MYVYNYPLETKGTQLLGGCLESKNKSLMIHGMTLYSTLSENKYNVDVRVFVLLTCVKHI